MVEVTYHCPYCGALTAVERDAYLDDKCVTREPLDGWEYAGTTEDFEDADGIEFVCLGDAEVAGGSDRRNGAEGTPSSDAGDGGGSNGGDGAEPRAAGDRGRSSDVDAGSAVPPAGPTATGGGEGGAGDPDHDADGCGRTFYLNFVNYEDGEPVDHRQPNVDRPRFDFLR